MPRKRKSGVSAGIVFWSFSKTIDRQIRELLDAYSLSSSVRISGENVAGRPILRLRLDDDLTRRIAPGWDTLNLRQHLPRGSGQTGRDLEQEILVAMLMSPTALPFPCVEELNSAIALRTHIVDAAQRTSVAFDTEQAERPQDYFVYRQGCGFCLSPGKSLIDALTKATQPEVSGEKYSFSCYRASEYVLLLAIAIELKQRNPALYARLESLWQERAIMSGEFHEVFLNEYGSISRPLPLHYFVPGDRVWFRNPDDHSSDVTGFEGSWVFYLGHGLFNNFWQQEQPYTLTDKCLEVYHWRHGVTENSAGELKMDEQRVASCVASTLQDADEAARILALMMRPREARGIYQNGGCLDVSRESPRWVCPDTSDIALPAC